MSSEEAQTPPVEDAESDVGDQGGSEHDEVIAGTSPRRPRPMPMSPPMPVRTRLQASPLATRRREAGGKRDRFTGPRMSSLGGVTRSSIVELVVIVAVALGLALGIQAFIIKPYRIPSGSMEPTLTIGQRVLVDRIGTHFSEPHVGEIAVFHPPKEAQKEVCGRHLTSSSSAQPPARNRNPWSRA